MTENLFAAVSGLVALSVLITLIAADNKSWLWRKAMFAGLSGFTITALLYWLNQSSMTYLYPHEGLAISSAIMMVPVALNYMLNLRGPITIPAAVLTKLKTEPAADALIAHYTEQATADQRQKFRIGLTAAGSGLFLIGGWFYLNHNYGLAQNFTGRQESIFKIVLRIARNQEEMNVKVDTLMAAGARRESRIGRLEAVNQKKARIDSINTARLLSNQKDIMSDQDRIKARLRPKAVPQTVPPIKLKQQWWQIGYRAELDSLAIARRP